MGWVARMSLPDATRSDRVYPLLQNLDLENLAFATLQGTGETLNIEEMNEDELRRLVLINLARLSVKGEWDGLLSAGGGGGITLPQTGATNETMYIISTSPIWGTMTSGTDLNISGGDFGKCLAFPFIAPVSGSLSACTIQVAVAGGTGKNVQVGFYSENDAKLPGTLLGYATISAVSTGAIRQTSFSSTVTLVAGTQYWYTINTDSAGSSTQLDGTVHTNLPNLGIGSVISETAAAVYDNDMTAYATPPATFSPTMNYGGFGRPRLSIEFS